MVAFTPKRDFAVAVLAAILLMLGVAGRLEAQQPAPGTPGAGPLDGVLVLRSGHLFRGRITRIGDRFRVQVEGGEVWVNLGDVDLCCRTVEEAYLNKKSQVIFNDANAHVQLAQWCHRQGLLAEAAAELAVAKSLEPNHPLIPLVERRLLVSAAPPSPPPTPPLTDHVASIDELDQMIRGMPPDTVDVFTQRIQPLLVHSCSTAQCHLPQSGHALELSRLPAGSLPNRRVTQRNLYSVLQCINRENPVESPLLQAPIRPHGTARAPIFTDRSLAQYKQMVDWVYRVAQVPANAGSPGPFGSPDSSVQPASHLQSLETERPSGAPGEIAAFSAEGPQASPVPVQTRAQAQRAGSRGSYRPQHAVKRGASPPQAPTADPFDPEIFNRRYSPPGPPIPAAVPLPSLQVPPPPQGQEPTPLDPDAGTFLPSG